MILGKINIRDKAPKLKALKYERLDIETVKHRASCAGRLAKHSFRPNPQACRHTAKMITIDNCYFIAE